MPLDYRIPASVKVPEWTPTSTLQQESLNDLQIKTAAKKQIEDAADQSALVAALKAHVGADGVPDFDGAINSLYTTRPKAAQMLAEQVTKLRENATKQHAAELDQHTKEAQLMAQLFDDKTDATSYPIARSLAVRLDPEADKILPPTWDEAMTPTIVSKIRQAGTTVAEQNRLEKDAQQQLSSGDAERGAAATMANAMSAEDWDNRLHQIALFAPKAVYEHWKATPFSPEAVAQARQMAIAPEKQAELDAQKAAQDRIAQNESVNQGLRAREVAVQEQRLKADQSGGGATGANTGGDAEAIADAIAKGDQPPSLTGLYRFAGPVRAALARKGYDLTRATEDWTATNKYLNTLNGAQQVRLRQAVTFANDSLGILEGLTKEWDAGQFPLLNKATLATAKQGALGQKAQSLATRLEAQIADLTSELGTVYKGGNSSTDESLRLAAENLNANWSKQTLLDAIGLVRKNLTIRTNSIKNTGVVAGREENPYAPPNTGAGEVPPDVAALLKDKPSMIYHLNVGDFQKNPDGTITRIRK